MSRYPFMTYVNQYMDAMRGYYADITWTKVYNRYRRINSDVKALFTQGDITTVSPKFMNVRDVYTYLAYRLAFKYSGAEYAHDQSALRSLFAFPTVNNRAFDDCLKLYPQLRAKRFDKRLPPLTDSEYDALVNSAFNVALCPDSPDFLIRAYALVMIVVCTGCRTKEIRYADLKDLDVNHWMLYIRHVKGEDSYGEPRFVPINPDAYLIIQRYLEIRSPTSPALFSGFYAEDYLSDKTLRVVKTHVEDDIGFSFDFRKLRRTFCQRMLDADVGIESASVLMGHHTTKTTEMRYGRIRSSKAISALQSTFERKKSNSDLTG